MNVVLSKGEEVAKIESLEKVPPGTA